MKFKIIASGRKFGTKIIDMDTGQELDNVVYCKIYLDEKNGGLPQVELGLTDVAVDVLAEDVKTLVSGMTGYFGE